MQDRRSLPSIRSARAWLFSAALVLFAGAASAEPQQARLALQQAQLQSQTANLHFQVGRSFANSGNVNGARSAFQQAQLSATLLGIHATVLNQQNVDSLQRGLYANRAALEQAIACDNALRVEAQVLQVKLTVLAQQPLSQQQIAAADIQLFLTAFRLQQCAQLQAQAGG